MSSLLAFGSRLSAPVAAAASDVVEAAVALVKPARNWSGIKEKAETRLLDLQTRRAGLYVEWRTAAVDEAAGDAEAGQRAGKIHLHMADLDREIAKLQDVLVDAKDHVAIETEARAAEAEQARLDGVAVLVNELHALADAAEKATNELAATLRACHVKVIEIRVAADRQEVHELGNDIIGALVSATQHRLTTYGVPGFGILPHGVLERASGKLRPGVDYVVNMAKAPRR
jgi:hypothetical protein